MTLSPPVLALRASRCPECHGAIRKEDPIVKDSKDGLFRHQECAYEPDPTPEKGTQ